MTEFDKGEAENAKSLAGAFTTNVTVVLWLRLPLTPVIVSAYVAAGVEQLVDTESVEDPETLIDAGVKLAVAPAGTPLTLRLTVPVKPFT